MIFVTVGSNGAPFDRLLRELDDLSPGEEVFVQRGPSAVAPAGATCVDYLPFAELGDLVRDARIVVTHAGVGSTLVAFSYGHRPIIVPRRRSFGEAVDDHQVSFGNRLHREGIAVCVTDPRLVRDILTGQSTRTAGPGIATADVPLVAELSSYLRSRCGGDSSESTLVGSSVALLDGRRR